MILTTMRKITSIRGKRLRWSSIETSVEAPVGPIPAGGFISGAKYEEIVSGTRHKRHAANVPRSSFHTMVCAIAVRPIR